RHRGIGVLVDRDASRRVRDVDERRGGAVELAERRAHQLGDVDELALLLRRDAELAHGAYPRQPWTEAPQVTGSSTATAPAPTASSWSSTRGHTSTTPA